MILPIPDHKFLLEHFDWLEACNFIDITPMQVIAKVVQGEYFALVGYDSHKPTALVICKSEGTTCFVVGLYAKNSLRKVLDEFLVKLKDAGFESLRSLTNHKEEPYERLLGMKRLWSVYERKL